MDPLRRMIVSSAWAKRATSVLTWIVGGCVVIVVIVIGRAALDAYRNAERLRDVQALTVALRQYAADHENMYPSGLDTTEKHIGSATSGCAVITDQCSVTAEGSCVDLAPALRPYLPDIPSDPASGSDRLTRYTVRAQRGGGLLVVACDYSK